MELWMGRQRRKMGFPREGYVFVEYVVNLVRRRRHM
jgi:hypothetical protein